MARLLTIFVLILSLLSQVTSRPFYESLVAVADKHENWMKFHQRVYKDEIEKKARFEIFKQNLKNIEELKAKNLTYNVGLNKFSDLTKDEFLATYTGYKPSDRKSKFDELRHKTSRHHNVSHIPKEIDWRSKGAVTPIKQQYPCGTCWAFATVAAVESIHQIKTGELIALSEQQVIDCGPFRRGCRNGGGEIDPVYGYIAQQGLASEASYPYQTYYDTEECALYYENMDTTAALISGYEQLLPGDEVAMLKAVSQQPIVVTLNADMLMYYTDGIVDGSECYDPNNHAVVIVGYGTDDGTDYWLMKNSWGDNWGEDGYFRIIRNSGIPYGACGLANDVIYPVV